MPSLRTAYRFLACLAAASALVAICFTAGHVNATTVALAMLLLVLGIATKWGLREAIFTSLLCVFAFNYFFLPPVGTLTIADPQNWVALTAFIVSAIVASKLSAQAKSRAEEAQARRREMERLYRLSRAMLMDEAADLDRIALTPIRDIFGLKHVAFYELQTRRMHSGNPGPLTQNDLARSAESNEIITREATTIIPVCLGTRVVGSLGLAGPPLTIPEQESVANLLAISYERTRALQQAAAAEAARQGEQLKTSILDGLAHDFKTPLTAIKTCVSTLITIPPRDEEKCRELLNIIDEETEHLHRTITEAIGLARIESRKVALQKTRMQLAPQIQTVILPFPDANRFVTDVPADLEITADAHLMSQVLRQVFENARKYSGGGPIEIFARPEGATVRVKVCDRGPGISPHELERIFDKFYRGTRGQAAAEGTGMGLAIAKGIVEAHHGRIWAENRPGGGAVFILQIPTT